MRVVQLWSGGGCFCGLLDNGSLLVTDGEQTRRVAVSEVRGPAAEELQRVANATKNLANESSDQGGLLKQLLGGGDDASGLTLAQLDALVESKPTSGSFREVFYDGCNGARLGEVVEVEVVDGEANVDGCEYGSRNDDGLLSSEEGDLLVPLG